VEGIHHHFQRSELEAQMRQVFIDDLESDSRALHELRGLPAGWREVL
jgi:hypothetical protein